MQLNKELVYFVGAGPGAPDLITLRGHKCLSEADVVIYAGSLVNPELLDYTKEGAEIYNSAYMDLDEIIAVMRDSVRQNKFVVRLHTGDMSIYGSIREQTEELDKLNIGYECVPGVSSFLGAASELKVEYTVPEISQSLIITRMEGRTPVPKLESLKSFASHRTSMVIFLSASMIEGVQKELLDGGYPSDTPALVIYKATWEDQKIVRGTLENIVERVKKEGINKTALIMVGDFLGKSFNYSKLYDKFFETEYRRGK